MKEIAAVIGDSLTIDGLQVSVHASKPQKPYKSPGRVAQHEAYHVAPNPDNVKRATNKPGPGYLGLTETYRFDAVAAVAPHVHGMEGTGHDLDIVTHSGASLGAAISGALVINHERVLAIAGAIEAKGEISGSEAKDIALEVDYGKEVVISIEDEDGNKQERRERVKWSTKVISLALEPSGEFALPKAEYRLEPGKAT